MATDLERLVVQLSADVTKYQNAMNRAQGITNRTARQIEGRFARMNRVASGSLASFGRGFAGALAAGFSVREAGQLIDAATRIDNALKVAGLSGAELDKVYQRLFQSATKNAAPLESLVELYGRAALVQKELGVSSEELLRFTNNVAVALRVSGKSASEASGALLQLSQALGSGVVRAEEFNSILEGAPAIAQAAAAGLKEAGGSVAALRQLVIDGRVSSEALFRAFEAGTPILEQKVSSSVLTISQRMTNLQTSLVNAAREFNNSTDAAETFGRQIDRVAEFVNSIDFDGLISQIRAVATEFGLGVEAARFFFSEIGRLTGLEGLGGLLTGGTGRAEFLGGALTVTSQSGIQQRIDDAFSTAVETAGDLTEQAILNSAREFGGAATTAKTGRLPASSANVSPVSLEDYAVVEKAGKELKSATTELIKKFEGFIATPKWDVNALRAGFGSDTVTLSDGSVQKVTAGITVSVADANRDLVRRIGEFQEGIVRDIGAARFSEFNEDQQAALTSIAYNYGSLPQRIVEAIKTGNAETIGNAIRGLGSDNGGVNRTRRNAEAAIFESGVPEGLREEIELRREQLRVVQELQAAGQTENARIQLETALVGASNAERERQMFIFERLNELQSQNIPITEQLRASVEAEAAARYGAVASYDATIAAQDAAAESAERLRQKQEELQYAQQEIAGAFQGALKGLITDLAHGKDATEALLNAVSRLADRLLDIALDMLFQNLFGGLAGGLGGGGLLAGLLHSGGKAGAAVAARTVSPLMFAGAQRYHSGGLAGLKPGEVPAILQRGELVLPRSQVRSMARSSQSSQNVDARTTVVNTFDAGSFLSEALSRPEGVKVVLNAVRAQPGAFRAAINA